MSQPIPPGRPSPGRGQRVRTLSVIVPVKNAAATLPKLLGRLTALQPPPGWRVEILAGLSPSGDQSELLLRRYGVKVVHCPVLGPAAARNAAARAASGLLYYFIDADACPQGEDFYRRLIGYAIGLAKRGRFGAYGGAILLDPGQAADPVARADHAACWFDWSGRRATELSRLFQPSVSLVMSRAVFRLLGGFDERILVLEDFDLCRRLQERGLQLYYVRELAVTHRARDGLLRSWRHSWSWGLPYRANFYDKSGAEGGTDGLRFSPGSPWFALDLPGIFLRRLRLVRKATAFASRREAWQVMPLVAATVFAWALAVVVGAYRRPAVPAGAAAPLEVPLPPAGAGSDRP